MGTDNSRFAEHGEDTSSPHAHGLACDYEYRIPVPGDPVEGTAHQDDEINTIPTRVSTPNNVDIRKAHHFIRLVDWEYGLGIRRAFEHSLWHEDFYVDETETIYGIWSDLCDVASCQMRRWERTSFSWEALSSDTQEELSRWSPKAKEYFEDPERAHWILLARFYHTLDERLFSADTAVKWNRSEGVNSHLAQVTDFFRKEYGKPWERHRHSGVYHAWRTLSQLLMDIAANGGFHWRPVGQALDHVEPLEALADVRALADHLERDMTDLVGPIDGDIAAYKAEWVKLARLAVDMDFSLMKSTWKYWFSWRPTPAGADGDGNGGDGRLWGFPMSKLAPPLGSSSTKIVGRCMEPWPIDGMMRTGGWRSNVAECEQNEVPPAQTVQLVIIPSLVADPHHCSDYICYARPMCVVLDPPEPDQRTRDERRKHIGNAGSTATTPQTG